MVAGPTGSALGIQALEAAVESLEIYERQVRQHKQSCRAEVGVGVCAFLDSEAESCGTRGEPQAHPAQYRGTRAGVAVQSLELIAKKKSHF